MGYQPKPRRPKQSCTKAKARKPKQTHTHTKQSHTCSSCLHDSDSDSEYHSDASDNEYDEWHPGVAGYDADTGRCRDADGKFISCDDL